MGPSLGEVPKYDMARVRIAAGVPPRQRLRGHASALTSPVPKPQQSQNTARSSHAANHPTRSAYHTNRCDAVPHGLRSQGPRRFTYD